MSRRYNVRRTFAEFLGALPLTPVGCGCVYFLIVLSIGAYSFAYCLTEITGKHVSWRVDCIAGIFLGEITIPLAVVLWILKLVGVHGPWI